MIQTASKLRLLYITRSFQAKGGGMERLAAEYVAALLRRPDIQLTVIAHRGSYTTLPFFLCRAMGQALCTAWRYDVIHLGDPLLSKIGWLIKMIYRKPIAVSAHGLDLTFPHFLYQLHLRLFFRNFNLYLPISNFTKELLEKQGVTGRIQVITPGMTDNLYKPTSTKPNTLFTVGRLVKRKGHAWFITHVLPKLPPDTRYVIAGTGPEELAIKQAALQAGVQNRVEMLGRVSEEKLRELYNSVTAFVQPNIIVPGDCEGFGLVLLEAALCERPVFASNLEGIPDAIHDGKNGTLLPAEDAPAWTSALTQFLKNPTPSSHARQYTLQNFSWSVKIEEYVAALKSLLL